MALLSALDTPVSGHANLQAAADNLAVPLRKKLAQIVGPLQDMLNDNERREVFASVPFDLLRVSGSGLCSGLN